MWMWFHTAIDDVVLFYFWSIKTVPQMIWSCLSVFVVAFLLEALKYWRLKLDQENTNFYDQPYKAKLFSSIHLIQTVLFFIQVVISYLLMLVFMSFSVWLGLAVALGSAFGFFIFSAKPQRSPLPILVGHSAEPPCCG